MSENIKLIDYAGLQACTAIANPELCFDCNSVDGMNKALEGFMRQLIELSGHYAEHSRCFEVAAVEKALKVMNINTDPK